MTESTLNKRIVTDKNFPVRFSFFKGFTGEMEYDKKKETEIRKWSSMILFPKKDTGTIDKIKKLINAMALEKWGNNIPKNLKVSFRDGDKATVEGGVPDGTEAGAEPYGGHYFMTIKSDRQPGIVGPDREPILDAGVIVSGDYGCISMNGYAWDNKNGKGISFGLGNIQFLKKGEPLGGAQIAPDKDFTPIAEAQGEGSDPVEPGNAKGNGVFDV